MTRGQRILIFVGLLVVAWLLHTTLCEWHYKVHVGSVGRSGARVIADEVDLSSVLTCCIVLRAWGSATSPRDEEIGEWP